MEEFGEEFGNGRHIDGVGARPQQFLLVLAALVAVLLTSELNLF